MRVSPGLNRPLPCLLLALLLCGGALPLGGCAWHHKTKSYNRIIMEGDPNPTIVDAPTRAGDTVRISNRPRQQPRPLPTDLPQDPALASPPQEGIPYPQQ